MRGLSGPVLINTKSRDADVGTALAGMLQRSGDLVQVYGVYVGAPLTRGVVAMTPGLRGFDREGLKACLLRYIALGWSGFVPPACRNTIVAAPQNLAGFLWGWPHRFTQRLKAAGSDVILTGPYDGSGFMSGINSADSFADVPAAFDGFVWTDRIEVIGPLNAARQ